MGAGENGRSGENVQRLVEAQTKAEQGRVTILLNNMEELIVVLMDHWTQKRKDVTKILVQVSINDMGRHSFDD